MGDTFRQERKKLDPSEFSEGSTEQTQETAASEPSEQVVPVEGATEKKPAAMPHLTPAISKVTPEQIRNFQREAGAPIPDADSMPEDMTMRGPAQMQEGVYQSRSDLPPQLRQMLQSGPQDQDYPQEGQSGRAPDFMSQRPRPEAQVASYGNEALDILIGGLNTHQYHEIMLPSMGKFYNDPMLPREGVLHVRPMTGSEEQILATPKFLRRGEAMNRIFASCIQEKIDPERLLIVDRTYLVIYLRGLSYGVHYEVNIKCPECGASFEHTINLDEHLIVNQCPERFSQESLRDVLPTSGYAFKYRLATGYDDSEVTAHRERRIRQFGDNAADDTFLYRASMLIESISNGSVEVTQPRMIQTLLQKLPVSDVNYIRNVISDPPFGVDTNIPIACPQCLAEFEVDLPMEANFFFPRRKKENPTPA